MSTTMGCSNSNEASLCETGIYSTMSSTDILLTHGPPHGIGNLDVLNDRVTHVGCEELTRKLENGEIKPLIHAFGHIHGKHWEYERSKCTPEHLASLCRSTRYILAEVNTTEVITTEGVKKSTRNIIRQLSNCRIRYASLSQGAHM